MIVDTDATTAP